MSKEVWLVIIILAALLATRQCIKDDKKQKQIIKSNTIEKKEFTSKPNEIYIPKTYTTRMTSFYTDDECNTGSVTASGLTTNDFNINSNGWYTYQGKLVIATASTRLGYTDMWTYNLYDNITIIIDGITYQGIVLDVCGACMRYNRIDLFVSEGQYAIDKYVEVEYE